MTKTTGRPMPTVVMHLPTVTPQQSSDGTSGHIKCPFADQLNGPLADLISGRLGEVENKFGYKAETSADMTEWREPVVDSLTGWVLRTAREFVDGQRAVVGGGVPASRARDLGTFNTVGQDGDVDASPAVSVAAGRSWARVYRRGDRHPAHFRPNTAISAIYDQGLSRPGWAGAPVPHQDQGAGPQNTRTDSLTSEVR